MTVRKPAVLLVALAMIVAAPAAAQTLGTPVFQAPYRAFDRTEFGGTFSDPGRGVALEGHYRFASGANDIGLRVGVRDNDPGDSQLLLGAEWRSRMLSSSEDFPFDGSLTLGVGAQLGGNNSTVLVPVGFSLGRRIAIEDSNVELTPYLHPVAALVIGDNSDLIVGIGLGMDIRLSRQLEVRVAGAIGDYDGVSIGVAFLR